MKKMKKTLCLFLALVMCLSLVNLSAFAADDQTGSTELTESTGGVQSPTGSEPGEETKDDAAGASNGDDGDDATVNGDGTSDGENGDDVNGDGENGGTSNTENGDDGDDANVNGDGENGGASNTENGDDGDDATVNGDDANNGDDATVNGDDANNGDDATVNGDDANNGDEDDDANVNGDAQNPDEGDGDAQDSDEDNDPVEEVPAEVQAFLDAVKALEALTETDEGYLEAMQDVVDAYNDLTGEQKAALEQERAEAGEEQTYAEWIKELKAKIEELSKAPEDEVPAAVQAFLDAVDELEAAVNAKDAEKALAQMDVCEEAFDALSNEDMEREDVSAAVVKMTALMEKAATLEEVTYIEANNVPVGNFYYDLHEDGTAAVVMGSITDGELNIPATVTYEDVEYRVTAIEASAFKGTKAYAKLTLPEGLETIGDYAFCQVYLTNETLSIPNTVTTIGENAFLYFNDGKEDAHVTKIVLGENVKTVGKFAFYTTPATPKLIVECGAGIESIDRSAFYNKTPYNVSSVTVNGPKYSLDSILGGVTGFKSAEITYTQGVDTTKVANANILREAIDAAEGPTTLTLTGYISTGKSSIVIPAGKDITIQDDGNMRTIETSYGLNAPAFVVEAGGKLTFTGTNNAEGKPNLGFYFNGDGKTSPGQANCVQVKGEFVLDNACLSGAWISGGGMTRGVVIVDNGGKFTMTGGEIITSAIK